jgi:acyl-coenzyme A synthetase/AMP-(fatty) acid ligase
MKIFDELGNDVPDGERGVLYAYNAIMMDGYYKNEKATKESYMEKYLTAGDVAVRDKDGYIFIDEIPRTPTGKILKRELRQKLENQV